MPRDTWASNPNPACRCMPLWTARRLVCPGRRSLRGRAQLLPPPPPSGKFPSLLSRVMAAALQVPPAARFTTCRALHSSSLSGGTLVYEGPEDPRSHLVLTL